MNRIRRLASRGVMGMASALVTVVITSGADAQTKSPKSKPIPSQRATATDGKVSARSAKEIEGQLIALRAEMPRYSLSTMLDPKYRDSMMDRVAPLLRKRVALLAEFEPVAEKDDRPVARSMRLRDEVMLCVWGDEQTLGVIEKAATSSNLIESTRAKVVLAMKDAWGGGNDATAQSKALDQLDAMAKEQPKNDDVAIGVSALNGTAVDGDIAERSANIMGTLKSPTAQRFNASPVKIGKPMVINGGTADGKTFSSKKWIGKVVMVDFWATWCPPCREEIPQTISLYQKYHDEGFEVIGVSSDNDKGELLNFVRSRPGMDWPQLFAGGRGWHPLTEKYGVQGIPRYFMIDRAGRLRTTEARGELEEWIKRLLAEPGDTQAAAR